MQSEKEKDIKKEILWCLPTSYDLKIKTKTLPFCSYIQTKRMLKHQMNMSQVVLKSTTLLASWIESIMGRFQNFEKSYWFENSFCYPPI